MGALLHMIINARYAVKVGAAGMASEGQLGSLHETQQYAASATVTGRLVCWCKRQSPQIGVHE